MNPEEPERLGVQNALQARALLLVGFGILAPLVVLGILISSALDDLSERVVRDQQILARSAVAHAEEMLRDDLEGLYGGGVEPDSPARRAALLGTYRRSRLFSSVFLLSPRGEILWEEPADGHRGDHLFDFPAAQEAVATGRRAASALTTLPNGARRLFLFVPLVDLAGKTTGLAGASLDPALPAFQALLPAVQTGEGITTELIDAAGEVVATTDPGPGRTPPVGAAFLLPLLQGRRAYAGRVGEDAVAFAPLRLFPWGVVVRERAAHAFAPAIAFRRQMLTVTPVFLALAALFTWGAARSVLRPLLVLTRAAERITGGDLKEPIPTLPDDEVGRLGRSLETMRARLERDDRRAELLKRFLSAQEGERMRIARELHDETCQTISALSFRLESALSELPAGGARERLVEVQGLAGRALDDLHRVIFDLRPSVLDDLGLLAAVRWYAARHLEPLGIKVSCEFEDVESRVPQDVATAVFRIVQEALLNVARHAGAEDVLVQIAAGEKALLIEIEDDGRGFDPGSVVQPSETGRGLGLLGMRERVEILGGKMSLDSAPGEGTHLAFEIPIPPEVRIA
ncbi:MAG: HAMP domain-containing protein [Thermoanaerobaculia bacterium]|nr:HAMP domain-containing protein [Thermoanaerobaculia bacterium]